MKRILMLICGAVCATGIDVPAIGIVVDAAGVLRSVQGVAGNFLLGPPAASGIISAACSKQLCLAKTDSQILSPGGETDAPPGPAIFGLSGSEAIVFFPDSAAFARWRDNSLEPLDWSVEGEVLSLRVVEGEVQIAVRRDGQVWIVRPDGSLIDSIANTAGPVLLLSEGVLFATGDAVVLRRSDGSEIRFDLAAAEAITQMGPNYTAARAGNATYAVRIDPGREQLFLLPAASGDPP